MEFAANKVKNTRIHERAAGRVNLGLVKWLIYKKALFFDDKNKTKKTQVILWHCYKLN